MSGGALGSAASAPAPAGPMTGQPGFAAGEMRPNGSKGRVFAVGDPARQSRDGDGKILVRGDEVMAAKRTTAREMRPNGSKSRGGNGSRVWEKRKVPRFRGADYESPTAYFLSIKKVGKER